MKIGINVGGYHNIGTGHAYRQITMMEEKPEYEYFFYINNKQKLANKLLEENLVNYKIFYNMDHLFDLIQKDKIDIIINDFLDTDIIYIKKLKSLNLFVVNFEDKGSGIKYADIVINDMYNNKLTDKMKNVYNGIQYTCMRRDLKIYSHLKFKNTPKNIIITFGGSDPQNFTKLVLDLIIQNNIHKQLNVTVILGLGYLFDEDIYKYKKYNITVLKNIINMPTLLQKGDIGITANGRTLFEFAHFCIPCISLAQNDREKIHTFAKEDNGVIFLGERKDFTDNDLLISINKLINNHNYRKKLSENMKQVNKIFQNSNKNIWKLILDKYNFQNTDIILQCRINSSRLPKKAIRILCNKKMIEHQIERLKRCKNINNIILCTSTNTENDILIEIANSMGIKHYRGSEDNVLERFYNCTLNFNTKYIVRCTGDCPLIDPSLIDLLCENFFEKNINHLNFRNKDITRNNNFPDGFDAEIFTFEVLEEAYKNDNSDFGKEHVTPYIVEKYGKNYCQIPNVEKYNLDNFHYSVDTEEDFKKIEEIYNELYPKNNKFTLYDILNNNIKQQQYLKVASNKYDIEHIVFDNTEFKNNSIEVVKEMVDLYNKMDNNASGDWKWISDNKINIDELFKGNNYNEIDKLYSNFARNFISFGIISNGVYEKLIKDEQMMYTLKQNILNDIDTSIELCDIKCINVLDTPRIGNFYGIVKNNAFITPDNIRHYYSAYKINNFICNVKNPTIMEIGAGYGGLLVNLLKSRKDKFCYINVDIRNTLLVFYYYIRSYIETEKLDKKIYFSENGNVTDEIISEFDIILIPSVKHQNIKGKIDLVFNSHSLSEMSKQHMEGYFETIHKLNIKHIFHVNSIYFPWKTSDRGHIQISTKDFPIDKNRYNKIYHCISPWMTGSGRYREYFYIMK